MNYREVDELVAEQGTDLPEITNLQAELTMSNINAIIKMMKGNRNYEIIRNSKPNE